MQISSARRPRPRYRLRDPAGIGIAIVLSLLQRVLERQARPDHAGQDIVGGAVQDARRSPVSSLAARHCDEGRMMGMPPPTLASNR